MIKIETNDERTFISISENADNNQFQTLCNKLEEKLKIKFKKIDDFDSYYWEFLLNGSEFVLYYSIWGNLHIYLKNDKNNDIEKLKFLYNQLIEKNIVQ